MRIAETVTFGGSGLDRAAQMRGDPARMAELVARGRVLALWRGRVLARDPGLAGTPDAAPMLAWLPTDCPVLNGLPLVFLGLDGDVARFGADLSDWSPEAGAAGIESPFTDGRHQHHPALPPAEVFVELRGIMAALTAREGELAATAKALLHWHRSHGFCAACGARSEPAMSGWQRNCPDCGAQHFPRTDPVVIMVITRGNSLLLGRSPGWAEGMYSLLAGFVEPGETMEAAVRREVAEETGIAVGPVRYLASQPWPFPASLMLGCAGEALSDRITLDPAELQDAFWLPREEVALALAGQRPGLRLASEGSIARFLIRNWLADRLADRPD